MIAVIQRQLDPRSCGAIIDVAARLLNSVGGNAARLEEVSLTSTRTTESASSMKRGSSRQWQNENADRVCVQYARTFESVGVRIYFGTSHAHSCKTINQWSLFGMRRGTGCMVHANRDGRRTLIGESRSDVVMKNIVKQAGNASDTYRSAHVPRGTLRICFKMS